MKWYDRLNEAGIEEIARKTGMKIQPKDTFQCPQCQNITRGSKDGRGAVGATANRKGWLCHRCGATGSLLDFVAFYLAGARYKDLEKTQRQGVYEWSQSAGYADEAGRRRTQRERVKDTLGALGRAKRTQQSMSSAEPDRSGLFTWGSTKPEQYKQALWESSGESVRDYLLRERKLSEGRSQRSGSRRHEGAGNGLDCHPLEEQDADRSSTCDFALCRQQDRRKAIGSVLRALCLSMEPTSSLRVSTTW